MVKIGVNQTISNPAEIPVGGTWYCNADNNAEFARLLVIFGDFHDLACTNLSGHTVKALAGMVGRAFVVVAHESMLCLMQGIPFERFQVKNLGDGAIAAETVHITLSKAGPSGVSREWI